MVLYTQENIRITTLADILNRAKYQDSVRPSKLEFRHVLAAYTFPRKIVCCGVTNCYQSHKKGYLVRTRDGGDASICERCANHFLDPAALKPPKAIRSRSRTASSTGTKSGPAAVQTMTIQIDLDTFIRESGKIKQRVQELKLKPRGANWLYQTLASFQKICPQELIRALVELKSAGEESTVFERLIAGNASDQQLEDVDHLQGLDILGEDIRELLIERILKPLTQLDAKAKKAAAEKTVAVPQDWNNQVEHNLEAAERLLAEAQLFFTEQNIKRMKSIPLADKAAQAARNLRWDEEKGLVTTKR